MNLTQQKTEINRKKVEKTLRKIADRDTQLNKCIRQLQKHQYETHAKNLRIRYSVIIWSEWKITGKSNFKRLSVFTERFYYFYNLLKCFRVKVDL